MARPKKYPDELVQRGVTNAIDNPPFFIETIWMLSQLLPGRDVVRGLVMGFSGELLCELGAASPASGPGSISA